MLRNRAVQVSLVKKDSNQTAIDVMDAVPRVNPDQIHQIMKDYTTHVAVTVGAVIVGNRLLKTACDIALIAAKAKLR